MKYTYTVIAVADIKTARKFYEDLDQFLKNTLISII